jgi:hypothetical protein
VLQLAAAVLGEALTCHPPSFLGAFAGDHADPHANPIRRPRPGLTLLLLDGLRIADGERAYLLSRRDAGGRGPGDQKAGRELGRQRGASFRFFTRCQRPARVTLVPASKLVTTRVYSIARS